jgi:phosphopantetheine--protein transferase-like protein
MAKMRVYVETVLRGGKLKEESIKYLSNLLNRKVDESTPVTLTSAQKSRFHSWLTEKQVNFDDSKLIKQFTLSSLFNSGNQPSENSLNKAYVNPASGNINNKAEVGLVGVDIQNINEIFPDLLPSDLKSDQALCLIFTLKELSYAATKDDPRQTLAGIFAAKEAVQKASHSAHHLIEIEILPDEYGRPTCPTHNLSISHSAEYAIAIAISAQVKIPKGRLEGDDAFLPSRNHLPASAPPRMNLTLLRIIEFIGIISMCALVIYKNI